MMTTKVCQLLLMVILIGGTIASVKKLPKCKSDEFIYPDRDNCCKVCDGTAECDGGKDEMGCNTGIYKHTGVLGATLKGLRNFSAFKLVVRYFNDYTGTRSKLLK